MLEYVARLFASLAAIVDSDIEALREVGFDDRAIGDIALNAAVFKMINRIVDGR